MNEDKITNLGLSGVLRRVTVTPTQPVLVQTPGQEGAAVPAADHDEVLDLDGLASLLRERLHERGEDIPIEDARIREAGDILNLVGNGLIDIDFALEWARQAKLDGTLARDQWGYIISPEVVQQAAELVAWEQYRVPVRPLVQPGQNFLETEPWQEKGMIRRGGVGSGDFSHAGRPGQQGGSAAGGGGATKGEGESASDYHVVEDAKLNCGHTVQFQRSAEERSRTNLVGKQVLCPVDGHVSTITDAQAHSVLNSSGRGFYTHPEIIPPITERGGEGSGDFQPPPSSQQVLAGMKGFSAKLRALPGVSDVVVQPGLGGYMGEQEPTWIVSYKGDGDALKLCAQMAKDGGEDAALFIGAKGRGTDSVVTDFQFDKPVTPVERGTIEKALIACGDKTGQMKGWQWFKDASQHSVLRSVCVPQWGGEADAHARAAATMSSFFKSIGAGHSLHEYPVGVGVLGKEGANAYDTVLNG